MYAAVLSMGPKWALVINTRMYIKFNILNIQITTYLHDRFFFFIPGPWLSVTEPSDSLFIQLQLWNQRPFAHFCFVCIHIHSLNFTIFWTRHTKLYTDIHMYLFNLNIVLFDHKSYNIYTITILLLCVLWLHGNSSCKL